MINLRFNPVMFTVVSMVLHLNILIFFQALNLNFTANINHKKWTISNGLCITLQDLAKYLILRLYSLMFTEEIFELTDYGIIFKP